MKEINKEDIKKAWGFVTFLWKRINEDLRVLIVVGFVGVSLTYIYFNLIPIEDGRPVERFCCAIFFAVMTIMGAWLFYEIYCFIRKGWKAFNEKNQ